MGEMTNFSDIILDIKKHDVSETGVCLRHQVKKRTPTLAVLTTSLKTMMKTEPHCHMHERVSVPRRRGTHVTNALSIITNSEC
jgi:hypothetical protein